MRELLFGTVVGSAMAAGLLLLAARPVDGRPVVALFSPGTSDAAMAGAVATAGGAIMGLSDSRPIVVSQGPQTDYADRLYAAGAWLVLDASLARLCADISPRSGSRS